MSRIAIIPARGGSKRIPRKNIREFGGKPMIAWSIEAAKASLCFDEIVVSTDDPEIADCARCYGASVPFTRPAELSDDHTPTIPVIQHAIASIQNRFPDLSAVCCIYATAPFLQATDISAALGKLVESETDFVFSATSFPFPIQRAIRVLESGRVEMFNPALFNTRSQDLEEAYHDAGQFYWGTLEAWVAGFPIFSDRSSVLLLPRHRVQDIDTPEDWHQAELLFQSLKSGNSNLASG